MPEACVGCQVFSTGDPYFLNNFYFCLSLVNVCLFPHLPQLHLQQAETGSCEMSGGTEAKGGHGVLF